MFSHDTSIQSPAMTPRQDRLEGAIAAALRNRGTRSELRTVVGQLIDLFRLQGIPPEIGIMRVRMVAARATEAMGGLPGAGDEAAGDAPEERVALVVRWASERYHRAD